MRNLVLFLLVISSAALAQTSTPAPTPPHSSEEPETVYSDAQMVEDQSLSRRTIEQVLSPVESVENQYARWKRPVCFNVYGLAPAAKYVMERRMKEIATQVGAPVNQDESCEPSVTIIFTVDPPATLQSIAAARPALVPGLDLMKSRVRQSQPIQAWYSTLIRGADGRRVVLYDGFGTDISTFNSDRLSRLNSGIETEIGSAIVVVDTNAIMGLQLGSLADLFAVLSLTEARFTSGCKEVETIANLMHKDCDPSLAPKAITPGDIALLTGVYKTDDSWLGRLQKQRIIGNMRKTLETEHVTGKRP